MRAELRDLAKDIKSLGWRIEGHTRSGHIRLVHPDGHKFTTAATGSDWRGRRNLMSELKRVSRTEVRA